VSSDVVRGDLRCSDIGGERSETRLFCCIMTNVLHKFLFIYLFSSALHVSGFLLAHLQRQVYNFDSGSSLLGMLSAPGC
jgi:hypothetical protein